ncbi:hypothetical protein [Sphingomonas sp. MS122]|uniref:hypothetical protein n=1 Tax=Sphingomonas sp. MS122 TaxID=3412683 RepID=UPI003C2E90C2
MIASGNGKTAILQDDVLTVHDKGPKGGYLSTKTIPLSSIKAVDFYPAGMVLQGSMKLKLPDGSETLHFQGQQNDVFGELHRELVSRIG